MNEKLVCVLGERLSTHESFRSCSQHFTRFPLLRRPLVVNFRKTQKIDAAAPASREASSARRVGRVVRAPTADDQPENWLAPTRVLAGRRSFLLGAAPLSVQCLRGWLVRVRLCSGVYGFGRQRAHAFRVLRLRVWVRVHRRPSEVFLVSLCRSFVFQNNCVVRDGCNLHAAADTGFKGRRRWGLGKVVTPSPSPNPKLV